MQIADTKKKIKKNTKAALNEIKKKACSLALAGCITLSQNGYGNYIHDYRQYFEHKRKPTKKKMKPTSTRKVSCYHGQYAPSLVFGIFNLRTRSRTGEKMKN